MNKSDFLQSARRQFKRVEINVEGFGKITVREMSVAESKELHARQTAPEKDDLEIAAWIAVRTLCDDQGEPLLTDADAEALKAMPLSVFKQIQEAVAEASGMKETPEAKKNEPSGSQTPPSGSPSSSAAPSDTAAGHTPTT